jgi:putative membrane protein
MRTAAFLFGLLLATPAMAQSVGEKSGVNSVMGVAPKTADFVKEAAISDMFEIQSSKLAAGKLTGDAKAFAERMIADHTKTTNELTSAAKRENIPLPAAMDSAHQDKLTKLSNTDARDFSKRYFDDQVSAHKDAVSLFQRYGRGGDDATLKNWANTTLPTLQHHLEMAQNLDK